MSVYKPTVKTTQMETDASTSITKTMTREIEAPMPFTTSKDNIETDLGLCQEAKPMPLAELQDEMIENIDWDKLEEDTIDAVIDLACKKIINNAHKTPEVTHVEQRRLLARLEEEIERVVQVLNINTLWFENTVYFMGALFCRLIGEHTDRRVIETGIKHAQGTYGTFCMLSFMYFYYGIDRFQNGIRNWKEMLAYATAGVGAFGMYMYHYNLWPLQHK